VKVVNDLSAERQTAIEHWAREHDFRLVVLFGSRARGDARPESDYDVAIWPGGHEQPRDRLRWVAQLEKIVGAPAQLVVVRQVDPVLGWEIARDGKPLVEAEEGMWTHERLRLWHLYNDSLPFRRLLRGRLADFAAEVRRGA